MKVLILVEVDENIVDLRARVEISRDDEVLAVYPDCSLELFPNEKYPISEDTSGWNDYVGGWNDCLSEIKGE